MGNTTKAKLQLFHVTILNSNEKLYDFLYNMSGAQFTMLALLGPFFSENLNCYANLKTQSMEM